jgi:hypothetical protein
MMGDELPISYLFSIVDMLSTVISGTGFGFGLGVSCGFGLVVGLGVVL